jgi:ribonuclease J
MVEPRRVRLPARLPAPHSEQQAGYLPRDKVLFICTGSQGEPRARWPSSPTAHRDLVLEAGDTAILSSRVIPGNERSAGGCITPDGARRRVITDHDAIHVSAIRRATA